MTFGKLRVLLFLEYLFYIWCLLKQNRMVLGSLYRYVKEKQNATLLNRMLLNERHLNKHSSRYCFFLLSLLHIKRKHHLL